MPMVVFTRSHLKWNVQFSALCKAYYLTCWSVKLWKVTRIRVHCGISIVHVLTRFGIWSPSLGTLQTFHTISSLTHYMNLNAHCPFTQTIHLQKVIFLKWFFLADHKTKCWCQPFISLFAAVPHFCTCYNTFVTIGHGVDNLSKSYLFYNRRILMNIHLWRVVMKAVNLKSFTIIWCKFRKSFPEWYKIIYEEAAFSIKGLFK